MCLGNSTINPHGIVQFWTLTLKLLTIFLKSL